MKPQSSQTNWICSCHPQQQKINTSVHISLMISFFLFFGKFHANLLMEIIPQTPLKQEMHGHCIAFWAPLSIIQFITSTSTSCCHVHCAWNKTVPTMMECAADDSLCEQVTFQQISALYALTWWFSKGYGWQQGPVYRQTFPRLFPFVYICHFRLELLSGTFVLSCFRQYGNTEYADLLTRGALSDFLRLSAFLRHSSLKYTC